MAIIITASTMVTDEYMFRIADLDTFEQNIVLDLARELGIKLLKEGLIQIRKEPMPNVRATRYLVDLAWDGDQAMPVDFGLVKLYQAPIPEPVKNVSHRVSPKLMLKEKEPYDAKKSTTYDSDLCPTVPRPDVSADFNGAELPDVPIRNAFPFGDFE